MSRKCPFWREWVTFRSVRSSLGILPTIAAWTALAANHVFRLHRKVVALRCSDVTVTGELFDYVDGEMLRPIRDARTPHVVNAIGTHTCSTAQSLKTV